MRPFKYQRSYGWLVWLIYGIMLALFVIDAIARTTWLMEWTVVTGLLILAAGELASGCALDRAFVASISRQESPIFFWLSIAFKVVMASAFLY